MSGTWVDEWLDRGLPRDHDGSRTVVSTAGPRAASHGPRGHSKRRKNHCRQRLVPRGQRNLPSNSPEPTGIALEPDVVRSNVTEAVAFEQAVMRGRRSGERRRVAHASFGGGKVLSTAISSFGYVGVKKADPERTSRSKLETRGIVARLGQNGRAKTTVARALMGIKPGGNGARVYLGGTGDFRSRARARSRPRSACVQKTRPPVRHRPESTKRSPTVSRFRRLWPTTSSRRGRRSSGYVDLRVTATVFRSTSVWASAAGQSGDMLVLEARLLVARIEPTSVRIMKRARTDAVMDRLRERYGTTSCMITPWTMRLVAEWRRASRCVAAKSPRRTRKRCLRTPISRESALLPPAVVRGVRGRSNPIRIALRGQLCRSRTWLRR